MAKSSARRVIDFTNRRAAEAPAPDPVTGPARLEYHDARVQGLLLRVNRSTGTRTWYYRKRLPRGGRVQYTKIGPFPAIGVAAARDWCAWSSAVVARGGNPHHALREQARQREAAGITWAALYAEWVEQHAERQRRRPEAARWLWARCCTSTGAAADGTGAAMPAEVVAWVTMPVREVTVAMLRRWHQRVTDEAGSVIANRALHLVRTVGNYAPARTWLEHPEGANPAKTVKANREQSRERFLDADELRRLFVALKAEADTVGRDFILLLLFTGARRGSLAAMRWADVDFAEQVWRVPAESSKSGEPLLVPLVGSAVDVLRGLSRLAEPGAVYVFPARTAKSTTPYAQPPVKLWARVRKASGLTDVTMHDLRRTLASWQARQGTSLQVIGKSLGHRSTASTGVYARVDLAPVREAMAGAVTEMGWTDAKPDARPPVKSKAKGKGKGAT